MSDKDLLSNLYDKLVNKSGIVPTVNQLFLLAIKQKIKVNKQIVAQFLRSKHVVAKFANVQRPKQFQTISILRPGVFFIDYAEFRPDLRKKNDNKAGFLVAVENVTNRLFVYPCGNKNTQSWTHAIETFLDVTQNVRTINSDRDAVATSKNFRSQMQSKFGISWFFLPKNSKSYLAERYIGFVKKKLSQAMKVKKTENWIQFIEPLTKLYNTQIIEPTRFTRQQVNRSNFLQFLSQLLKAKDPELEFNASKIGPFSIDAWNKKCFKFAIGDKVLLSKSALWKNSHGTRKKTHIFSKRSVEGGFTSNIYTVSNMQLRKTKQTNSLVSVYSLTEMGPNLHFYESELKSVES